MTPSVIRSIVLGIAIVGVALPVHAQMMAPESSKPAAPVSNTVAEVRTDGGVVMVSADGGPFQTAVEGQRVDSKSRVMVSKESAATVIYDDGCRQKYDKPGIYDVSETCVLPPPAVAAAGGGAGAPKLLIGAGVAIGLYAIVDSLNDDNDDDQQPVSR